MILLDSSFLIAYHNSRDAHHPAAAAAMPALAAGKWGQVFLLEYLFLEVATVLLARRGRDLALDVTAKLLEAREVEHIPCSPYFRSTYETFRAQPGRDRSFADSALLTVAQQRNIQHIATFDSDFEDLGLSLVPGGGEKNESRTPE